MSKIQANKSLPTREWDFKRMEFFTERDLGKINKLAAGLSDMEVLAFYGLTDITVLSGYEQEFVTTLVMKGRSEAKLIATEKLFKVMGSTSPKAADACLAFLSANADKWKDATSTDGSPEKTVTITVNDASITSLKGGKN